MRSLGREPQERESQQIDEPLEGAADRDRSVSCSNRFSSLCRVLEKVEANQPAAPPVMISIKVVEPRVNSP